MATPDEIHQRGMFGVVCMRWEAFAGFAEPAHELHGNGYATCRRAENTSTESCSAEIKECIPYSSARLRAGELGKR